MEKFPKYFGELINEKPLEIKTIETPEDKIKNDNRMSAAIKSHIERFGG
jgi:hypothetical protein